MTENALSFTAPEPHYYLWHLLSLGVIAPEAGTGGLASPSIATTLWDKLKTDFPNETTPARVALIDIGVSRTHPNLADRIETDSSIDLVTHPYGARSVPPDANTTSYDPEGREAFFQGLSLSGLGSMGLTAKGKAWLAELVTELVESKGVVRTLLDTDDTFGSHGTGIAGLVVGEPAVLDDKGLANMLNILADDGDEVIPSDVLGQIPYFGVDPLSKLISIRSSFEPNAAHFVSAFLYAWKTGADVILLPRGIPDPVRGALRHKAELDDDLELRKNWERADLFARLEEATKDELRPLAVGRVERPKLGWDVLAKLIVAISKKIPIVCAAGNDGESQLIYPASLADDDDDDSNGIIAVGAVSGEGRRSGYSNYGKGLTLVAPSDDGEVYNRHQLRIDRTNPMVELHALLPGTAAVVPYSPLSLLTTDLPGSLGYVEGTEPMSSVFAPLPGAGQGGGFYTSFGGTSGASALVAGVAALVARAHKARKGANERIDGIKMKKLLKKACDLNGAVLYGGQPLTPDPMNADDEALKGKPYFFGAGLLNAKEAVEAILTA